MGACGALDLEKSSLGLRMADEQSEQSGREKKRRKKQNKNKKKNKKKRKRQRKTNKMKKKICRPAPMQNIYLHGQRHPRQQRGIAERAQARIAEVSGQKKSEKKERRANKRRSTYDYKKVATSTPRSNTNANSTQSITSYFRFRLQCGHTWRAESASSGANEASCRKASGDSAGTAPTDT